MWSGAPEDTDSALCQADRGPASVTLGTGLTAFEPFPEGGELLFERGPQGGYHLYGSARFTGVHPGGGDDFSDPTNPSLTFEVTKGGAYFGGFSRLPRVLQPVTDGTWERVGDLVILDVLSFEEADGAQVSVTVSLEDACGTQLSASGSATLVYHPTDQNPEPAQ